jgi:tRNA A37 threonylcarbamoyladenosine dehydratase
MLHHGHVWRIGFQHQVVQRQSACQRPQFTGTFKCQHTAKAELEAEIAVLCRLLQAAVKGMRDAATNPYPLQCRQHLVMCLAHMQQYRQPGCLRQLQLSLEQELLAPMIQSFQSEVETDLAYGHGRLPREPGFQGMQILRPVLLQVDRMQAICRVKAIISCTEVPQSPPAWHGHPRDHEAADTAINGTLQDGFPVRIERGNIEVAMGINNLHNLIVGARLRQTQGLFSGMACLTRYDTMAAEKTFTGTPRLRDPASGLQWRIQGLIGHGSNGTVTNENQDAERRFGGIRRLYGQAALGRFRQAHVCVTGIGGVGSWAAEALARSAIGRITLIDLDHVAESNINRQLPALTSTLGMAKVRVMAERIQQINPDCDVTAIEEFITVDNLEQQVDRRFDFVIDCIDGFRTKARLIAHCRRNRIPLVTVGGAGGQTDPTRIRIADLSRTEHDALFSKTRKLLRTDYGFTKNPKRRFDVACVYSLEQPVFAGADGCISQEKPSGNASGGLTCVGGLGSAMPVTASFGLAAAAHVLNKLRASGTSSEQTAGT